MAFEPFPPPLLARIADLPETAEYGFELLPLLRWLDGHLSPRTAAMIEDGRNLAAPVLAAAVAPGCPVRRLTHFDLGSLPTDLDLVHLVADLPADALSPVLAVVLQHLSPAGVIVITGPGQPGSHTVSHPGSRPGATTIPVPVAGGISLVGSGSPPPVVAWLAGLDATALREFAALFDTWGRQIGVMAGMQAQIVRQARQIERSRRAGLHAQSELDMMARTERTLRTAIGHVEVQRQALLRSTSWKVTKPLRTVMTVATSRGTTSRDADGRNAPPAEAPAPGSDDAGKAHFKAEAAQALWDFLVSHDRLRLPVSRSPEISVLLVLYNQAPLTFLCLESIAAALRHGPTAEVVIVDNASSDETARLLDRVIGATVIRNTENRHFLHALNQAAAAATGRDLLLLNNDAQLRPGTLQAAERTLHSDPEIAAVGGKIILPDGRLQEAGSIVWQDGTCVGYGRGRAPDDPEFQFRRDVDFCSGAFLLVRTDAFRALGGLDPVFAPAYYEEVDLCMRLRDAGHRVVYEPQAEIDHYEFGSAADSAQALDLQRRNHSLFAERHAARLASDHLPPTASPLLARMPRDKKRILYIDDRVPYPELGAGYPRAARLLQELVAEGWFVTFYPAYLPDDIWTLAYDTFPREIEIMLGAGRDGLAAFLAERDGYYDTILVSRPHNMRDFLAARGSTHAGALLIYDAEAMFSMRELLRLKQRGTPASREQRRAMLKEEIALSRTAAVVTTVNEQEAEIFRGGGCSDVRVLGLGVEPRPIGVGFAARHDFLFVGSLDEDNSPNADAILWFVHDVMPLIDARLGGDTHLLVAGRCAAPTVRALANGRIQLLGIVDDLTPLYARARVFIAPSRYAAGLPLKVHEAVSRGLPVVATDLLGKQLGWTDGHELLLATTAADFAESCVRLYQDAALWHALRRQSLDRLTADVAADSFTATLRRLLAGQEPAEGQSPG